MSLAELSDCYMIQQQQAHVDTHDENYACKHLSRIFCPRFSSTRSLTAFSAFLAVSTHGNLANTLRCYIPCFVCVIITTSSGCAPEVQIPSALAYGICGNCTNPVSFMGIVREDLYTVAFESADKEGVLSPVSIQTQLLALSALRALRLDGNRA